VIGKKTGGFGALAGEDILSFVAQEAKFITLYAFL
jgi:hypothetical protein